MKDRMLKIKDRLNSIKILGPKRNEDDVLMEVPNRRDLFMMLLQ